jgi:hypothetical protein
MSLHPRSCRLQSDQFVKAGGRSMSRNASRQRQAATADQLLTVMTTLPFLCPCSTYWWASAIGSLLRAILLGIAANHGCNWPSANGERKPLLRCEIMPSWGANSNSVASAPFPSHRRIVRRAPGHKPNQQPRDQLGELRGHYLSIGARRRRGRIPGTRTRLRTY